MHLPRLSSFLRLATPWLATLVLLAPLAAPAQNLLERLSNTTVVQSEQARAELLAHAPEGAGPGA